MLDNGTKTKTYSILETDLSVNGTVETDTGIYVTVAANTAYRLECVLNGTGSADALRARLVLGATPAQSGLYSELMDTTHTTAVAAINTAVTFGTDFVRISGIFVSNHTGILKVVIREAVNFGGASTLVAGSYLLVEPI